MKRDDAIERLNDARLRMATYGLQVEAMPSMVLFPMVTVLANVLNQVQWAERLVKNGADEVSEEVLLNLGYIRGILERFEHRELSTKPIRLLE
jgi:hypothetical protein